MHLEMSACDRDRDPLVLERTVERAAFAHACNRVRICGIRSARSSVLETMSRHGETAGATPVPRTPVPGTLSTSLMRVNTQSTIVAGASAPGSTDAANDPATYW